MSSTSESGFNLDAALALKNLRLHRPMLQWRTELEQFCQFMVDRAVQSFLEIGVGSGQLSVLIKDVLNIGKVYACDVNRPPLLRGREDIPFFHGDHHGASYSAWREALGPVDMIFIDADHECGFRLDYTSIRMLISDLAYRSSHIRSYSYKVRMNWKGGLGGAAELAYVGIPERVLSATLRANCRRRCSRTLVTYSLLPPSSPDSFRAELTIGTTPYTQTAEPGTLLMIPFFGHSLGFRVGPDSAKTRLDSLFAWFFRMAERPWAGECILAEDRMQMEIPVIPFLEQRWAPGTIWWALEPLSATVWFRWRRICTSAPNGRRKVSACGDTTARRRSGWRTSFW